MSKPRPERAGDGAAEDPVAGSTAVVPPEHDEEDLDVNVEYACARGVDSESLAGIRPRLQADFHPLSEAQLRELGEVAGFTLPRQYFRGVAFVANELQRRSD